MKACLTPRGMVWSRVPVTSIRALWIDWILPLTLLGALAAWMAAGDRELTWEKTFYGAELAPWPEGETALARWIYRFGPLPALLSGVVAVLVLIAGYRWPRCAAWRRVSWFVLALLAVGPGLVTNAILKDHYGRPRPREVDVLGGVEPYERFLQPDPVSDGKSFPCGHATMGFVFVGGYFLARRSRRKLALAFLVLGLGYGGLIGYVRMVQGGHFATDVVAAAMVVWATAAGLYYMMGLHRRVLLPPESGHPAALSRIPWRVRIVGGLTLFLLLTAVLLATPYQKEHRFAPRLPEAGTLPVKLSLTTVRGDVFFRPGPLLGIQGRSFGHGAPGSKLGERHTEAVEGEGDRRVYRLRSTQYESGWLTELGQHTEITVPWERIQSFKLECGRGSTDIVLGPLSGPVKGLIEAEGSRLTIHVPVGTWVWLPVGEGESSVRGALELADPSVCRIGGPRPKPGTGWLSLDLQSGPGTHVRIVPLP